MRVVIINYAICDPEARDRGSMLPFCATAPKYSECELWEEGGHTWTKRRVFPCPTKRAAGKRGRVAWTAPRGSHAAAGLRAAPGNVSFLRMADAADALCCWEAQAGRRRSRARADAQMCVVCGQGHPLSGSLHGAARADETSGSPALRDATDAAAQQLLAVWQTASSGSLAVRAGARGVAQRICAARTWHRHRVRWYTRRVRVRRQDARAGLRCERVARLCSVREDLVQPGCMMTMTMTKTL